MARTLLDFLHKHDGQTAWIFGKGPSLDRFDMDSAGPLRCAINDVVQAVPGCVYCFASDSVRAWKHLYREQDILFQPDRALQDSFVPPGSVVCERVGYPDDYDDERIFLPRAELARGLAIRRGTLNSALQILHIMGVSRVVAVGIDGGQSHAGSQTWFTRLRNEHFRDYNSIRNQFILGARHMGIDLEFSGAGPDQLPNGMIQVKFLRGTFVKGVNYYAGEIAEISPVDADILIVMGKAERVKQLPREAPAVMDTTAVEPRTEVATAPKGRRLRKTARK